MEEGHFSRKDRTIKGGRLVTLVIGGLYISVGSQSLLLRRGPGSGETENTRALLRSQVLGLKPDLTKDRSQALSPWNPAPSPAMRGSTGYWLVALSDELGFLRHSVNSPLTTTEGDAN
ncbi:hypothetical protein TNCV_1432601 [Trichonephila clavipes]|nr:hypothetical protein TNCV_1432601 [Trichonephila clavipes]